MELLADRDPEEARRILDPVLVRMMEAVHHYEGIVNQVMGDGIMALFGAPIAHEDHAVRGCYASLRMQDAIRRYADEMRRAEGLPLAIRVGLNSGEVIVRSIDTDLHMDYSAVGQTTHVAARMEQAALPGSIVLSPATLRLAEGYVQAKTLGPIAVKGLTEPIEAFELLGATAVRTRVHAAGSRGLTRFVGRDLEMEQLHQAAQQARHARGQVVAVVGEPGVGKSRLFYEFVHSHRSHGALVLESSCVSYGRARPFLPLADLLRAYFHVEDRDDTRSVRAKVTGTLFTLDRTLEDALAALLWLLDALPGDDGLLALDPVQRRQRAIEAVKRLLLRESQVQPIVLVFEDLHWIDAETQIALNQIVESLPTASILLAVNYRPEYEHRWGGKTYCCQLRIDPLASDSAEELLRALLGDDAAIARLKRVLIERTEGNPLFLEESVRSLVETHVLAGEPGAYRLAKPIEAMHVPATVQAILAARIDRLRPEVKRLLQSAAVVGKDVPFALLEAVAEMSRGELGRALTELQAGEFFYEARSFPDLEYTFKHALTHEVAYRSVLQERRQMLHAAILEAIERLHAGRFAEQVETLAHHALKCGDDVKALRYLREAGAKAVAKSANRQAIEFFSLVLEILERLPQTSENLAVALETRIALGPAIIVVKGGATHEAESSYLRARELAERLGNRSGAFAVLWGLWYCKFAQGRYAAARPAAEHLLVTARERKDTGQVLEAHHSMWATHAASGMQDIARPQMERGVALYDRERHGGQAFLYGGHDAGACCRFHLAMSDWLLGFPDRCLRPLEEAFRLSAELDHPLTTGMTLWYAALIRFQRGDRDAAATLAERLLTLGDEYGFTNWNAATIMLPLVRTAKPADAAEIADVQRRFRAIHGGWANLPSVFCLCVFAELYAEAGQPDAGLDALASITAESREAFFAAEILRLEGELLLRRPAAAAEEPERRFRMALDISRRRGERSFELRAATSLARLWQRQGKRDEPRRLVKGIYGGFTEGFETADLRAARALLEELG